MCLPEAGPASASRSERTLNQGPFAGSGTCRCALEESGRSVPARWRLPRLRMRRPRPAGDVVRGRASCRYPRRHGSDRRHPAPDRGQFLLEFIRRSHNLPFLGKVDGESVFDPCSEHLTSMARPLFPRARTRSRFPCLQTSGRTWSSSGASHRPRCSAPLSSHAMRRCSTCAAVARRRDASMDRRAPPAHRRRVASRRCVRGRCAGPAYRPDPDLRLPGDDVADQSGKRFGWSAGEGRRRIHPGSPVTQGDGRMALFLRARSRG